MATEVGLKPTNPYRRHVQSVMCLSFHHSAIVCLAEAEGNAPSSLISKTSALLLSYAPTVLAGNKGIEPSPFPMATAFETVSAPCRLLPKSWREVQESNQRPYLGVGDCFQGSLSTIDATSHILKYSRWKVL